MICISYHLFLNNKKYRIIIKYAQFDKFYVAEGHKLRWIIKISNNYFYKVRLVFLKNVKILLDRIITESQH
jgi:hypothetical protein